MHSHYWLSGRTGVAVKERLGVPLANSFHTLGKVKDLTRSVHEPFSPTARVDTEEAVIARSEGVTNPEAPLFESRSENTARARAGPADGLCHPLRDAPR